MKRGHSEINPVTITPIFVQNSWVVCCNDGYTVSYFAHIWPKLCLYKDEYIYEELQSSSLHNSVFLHSHYLVSHQTLSRTLSVRAQCYSFSSPSCLQPMCSGLNNWVSVVVLALRNLSSGLLCNSGLSASPPPLLPVQSGSSGSLGSHTWHSHSCQQFAKWPRATGGRRVAFNTGATWRKCMLNAFFIDNYILQAKVLL